jgi:hypothetical protein
MTYLPINNYFQEKHLDIKYINEYTFIITLTTYNKNNKLVYTIDNNNIFLHAKYNKKFSRIV